MTYVDLKSFSWEPGWPSMRWLNSKVPGRGPAAAGGAAKHRNVSLATWVASHRLGIAAFTDTSLYIYYYYIYILYIIIQFIIHFTPFDLSTCHWSGHWVAILTIGQWPKFSHGAPSPPRSPYFFRSVRCGDCLLSAQFLQSLCASLGCWGP